MGGESVTKMLASAMALPHPAGGRLKGLRARASGVEPVGLMRRAPVFLVSVGARK